MIYTNIGLVIMMSFGYFLVFAPFFSVIILSASILEANGYGNLGFYAVAIVFIGCSLSSFFSSHIVGRLGINKSFILSATLTTI
jgi:hypothetical protein